MRMQCHCDKRRIPLVQLKQPATQILTALLLQQRRWDRPLGTVHFATAKCQLIQLFATIQVTKNAIHSVRWSHVCSGHIFWTFGRLPSHEVAPTKSQCRSAACAQYGMVWYGNPKAAGPSDGHRCALRLVKPQGWANTATWSRSFTGHRLRSCKVVLSYILSSK